MYRLRIQSMVAERRAEHSALNRTIAFTVREEQAAARTEPAGKKGIQPGLMLQRNMP